MRLKKASVSRACYTYEVGPEANEEGIRILEYDMCMWVRYKWVNKKRSRSKTRGNPSFPDEI